MRRSRKLFALLLVAAFVMGSAGCARKELTRQNFIAEIESYGIEKTDNIGALSNLIATRGGKNGYFVAADKDEAEKYSNLIVDRFDTFPDIKTTDFIMAAVSEKGSDGRSYPSFICYMSFANTEDAKEAYNVLVEKYGDEEDGKTGTSSGVTYSISSSASAAGYNKIGGGFYLQGNTVVFLDTQAAVKDNYKFADTICGKFGLPSPSKAG